MAELSGSRVTRALKLMLFTLTPVVILLVIGHVVASAATHRELAFEVDSLTGYTTYRMRVGAFPWSHRSETRMNPDGFADIAFANLPPKGECLHVVLAGDSFTFGDVTDGDKTWASLLRDAITGRHAGRCIRVFNLAAPVTTIEQQAKRIRETLPVLAPDVVLLGQYQNDLIDLTNYGSIGYRPATTSAQTTNWGDRLRASIPGFDSPLPRLLTYSAFKFCVEQGIRVDILRRWSVLADSSDPTYTRWLTGLYEQLYDSLATELRQRKIPMAVVIMPSKFDLMAKRYPEGDFFAQLAKARGIPALSVYDTLDRSRSPMPYYTFDGHLDERGNRIVAAAVYQWLFRSPENPLPILREAAGPEVPLRPVKGFPR